jgi:hypothetical protein
VDRLKAELREAKAATESTVRAAHTQSKIVESLASDCDGLHAEVDRLRAQIAEYKAAGERAIELSRERGKRHDELQAELQAARARIRDLEARPVGGAAEMREASGIHLRKRANESRDEASRQALGGNDLAERVHQAVADALYAAAVDVETLPLPPSPQPAPEPVADAVPEGHRRVWIRVSGDSEWVLSATVWKTPPERLDSTVAIVVVDIPIAPTVRGAVVGGGR